jgi:hypothetical protein
LPRSKSRVQIPSPAPDFLLCWGFRGGFMKPCRSFLPGTLLSATLLSYFSLLACGGGNNHALQSVSITPASATSQAQFTATGLYGSMPTSANITGTTTWCVGSSNGVCDGQVAIQVQLVAGTAQCLEGASGTFTVLAGQPANMPGVGQGPTLIPFGSAQITCP